MSMEGVKKQVMRNCESLFVLLIITSGLIVFTQVPGQSCRIIRSDWWCCSSYSLQCVLVFLCYFYMSVLELEIKKK